MWYSFTIYVLKWAFKMGSLIGNKKARKRQLLINSQQIITNSQQYIWCHCASAGEFEQVIPLLSIVKKTTNLPLCITFFSPSGYYFHRNNSIIDQLYLFSDDLPKTAKHLIENINPAFCIWVKKEMWLNTLEFIKQKNIQNYLINYYLPEHKNLYNYFVLKQLHLFEKVFCINKLDFNFPNFIYVNDTKWESVINNKLPLVDINNIKNWTKNNFTVVLGSCWEKELLFIQHFKITNEAIFKTIKWIIVPHDIHPDFVKKITNTFTNHEMYNTNTLDETKNVLIINKIGLLRSIYQLASISIVGGGFKNGIHNILEPAIWGSPILFGPKHAKFPEADILISQKIGFEFNKYQILEKNILFFYSQFENKALKNIDYKVLFKEQCKSSSEIATTILKSIDPKFLLN